MEVSGICGMIWFPYFLQASVFSFEISLFAIPQKNNDSMISISKTFYTEEMTHAQRCYLSHMYCSELFEEQH